MSIGQDYSGKFKWPLAKYPAQHRSFWNRSSDLHDDEPGGSGARGAMNFGKNKAKALEQNHIKVRFQMWLELRKKKQELVEVVEFLRDPKRLHTAWCSNPAGVLLEGPPGTGKTLLAKAVAGEAGVPFFSISGSDFRWKCLSVLVPAAFAPF